MRRVAQRFSWTTLLPVNNKAMTSFNCVQTRWGRIKPSSIFQLGGRAPGLLLRWNNLEDECLGCYEMWAKRTVHTSTISHVELHSEAKVFFPAVAKCYRGSVSASRNDIYFERSFTTSLKETLSTLSVLLRNFVAYFSRIFCAINWPYQSTLLVHTKWS